MLRTLLGLGWLGLLSTSLGCAMCCGTDDYNYGAYGGRWQRHDMAQGRVGSVLSGAGAVGISEDVFEILPADEGITAEPPAARAESP